MSNDVPRQRGPVPPGTYGRVAFVFLLFLIAAPPLGAIVLVAGFLSILHGLGEGGIKLSPLLAAKPDELWKATRLIGGFSYLFGGVQAACVAVVVAVVQLMRPSDFVRFLPMLIAAIVVAMAVNLIFIARMGLRPELLMLAVLGAHLGAGIGCWLIANALLWPFRRRQGLAGAGP